MKIVSLLFFVPTILCAAHATAQHRVINIPITNSLSEITESDIQPQMPTAEELANPVVIEYGRNGERDIPTAMALGSYVRFALRVLTEPSSRAGWYAVYDLDQKKEETLKAILNGFLADYEKVQNDLKAESCNVYYTLKATGRDAAAERNAYELLREDLTGAEPLVAPTIAAIRAEVSASLADVVEGVVKKEVETGSMAVHNHEAFNARHGVTAEEFFSKTCTQ